MVSALIYEYRVVWVHGREHRVVFLGKTMHMYSHSQPLSPARARIVRKEDNTIQRIAWCVLLKPIRRRVIYSVVYKWVPRIKCCG